MLASTSCATLSFDIDSPVWFFSRAPSTPITSVAPAVSVAGAFVGVADVDADEEEFSAMLCAS